MCAVATPWSPDQDTEERWRRESPTRCDEVWTRSRWDACRDCQLTTTLLQRHSPTPAEHLTTYTGIICLLVIFLTRVCACTCICSPYHAHNTLAGKRFQVIRLTWKTNLCRTNLLQSCVQQLLSSAPTGQGGKICWESTGRGDWCDICSFFVKICYFRK